LEAQEAATISSLSVQEKLSQAALEIESQSTNLRRIQDRVQVAEGTLALTQRAASLSHAAYDAGLIAYTELFESQGAVLTAEETLIQLKLSHITTLHNLAYALGLDAQSLTELYQQPHIL
jgi:outer membrane protein TolC